MRVLVLIKVVPDTETRVRVAADGRSLDEGDVRWALNPYDEYAIAEGMKIVEAAGQGSVTGVTVGDERVSPKLREALALGLERCVLLGHPAFQGGDGLATARALAAACGQLGFDLILAGKQGVGHDRAQVPAMVAELLDLPHVAVVTSLQLAGGKATAEREVEGGREVFETALPAVITCQKGLNEPKLPSLKGIMAAKKKPIDVWGPEDVGLKTEEVGAQGAAERWVKLELPPARPQGKVLKGEAKEVARELVRLLSEEAQVL